MIVVKSRLLRRLRHYVTGQVQGTVDNSLLLLGRMASWQVRSKKVITSLDEVEFKVFSQWGEDGIVEWLVEQAQIPPRFHTFVEFGIESYAEANTRFLLQNRNWRGLVIDGNPAQIELLKKREVQLFWRYDLTARTAFVTRENINDLIIDAGFSGEIGLLSIDIDGNDYWIWQSIDAVRPIICICEYNSVFGDVWPISIPYGPDFVRTRPEFASLYFGASIVALQSLANRKGYHFLGTNSEGVNAFFIRKDYAHRFESLIVSPTAQPSKVRESRDRFGELSFVGGLERSQLIRQLPVTNTETLEQRTLGSLKPLYSDKWLEVLDPKSAQEVARTGCSQ
jgi:hypothetical protein